MRRKIRNFHHLIVLAFAGALFAAAPPAALAKAPLDAFSDAPPVRAAELSPDGRKVAFLNRIDGEDFLVIYDFDTNTSKALARVTDLKARDIQFVSDKYVILLVSRVARDMWVRGRWEESTAFSVNTETGKTAQLLSRADELYPTQTNLGNIVAVDPDGEHVYIPAFSGRAGSSPSLDLYYVSLENGRGSRNRGGRGQSDTVDWVLNDKGEVLAREDFSVRQNRYEIRAYTGSFDKPIHQSGAPVSSISLVGASSSGQLIVTNEDDAGTKSIYEMSRTDGALTGPLVQNTSADVDAVITDTNRKAIGVRYSGMRPTYEMFDPQLDAAIAEFQDAVPNSAIWLDSWTADMSRLLFFVDGGDQPERYILMNRADGSKRTIINTRADIAAADIGETAEMYYTARDGLKIPGIITWPIGSTAETRSNLPLVVMPHGGPEAYDTLGWHWLAQFIANEGYLVLQPNFRGSRGFGSQFTEAGRGEWGRKMQDDITDGVEGLASAGMADPDRTCIVGWSYGGYAALAGGAMTPDLYRCVVSIAGVSDLNAMLNDVRALSGPNSRSFTYWKLLIGDPSRDRDAIAAISPVNLADRYTAPVLLIHGTDDTTVPSDQSDRMNKALTAAGKEVKYLRIKGDDHGLSTDESRRTALTALADFLALNLRRDN